MSFNIQLSQREIQLIQKSRFLQSLENYNLSVTLEMHRQTVNEVSS
jgi:hypothetical protein